MEIERKIQVLGELIDLCDQIEEHEQKANNYKELKQYNKYVSTL